LSIATWDLYQIEEFSVGRLGALKNFENRAFKAGAEDSYFKKKASGAAP
jgi:hypothetical protein